MTRAAAPPVPVDALGADDISWVLALNDAHVAETSPLDGPALAVLLAASFRATGAGRAAFLLALDEGADYASPNFLWFRARSPRFVYVDRIVVAPQARGRGLARRLYADLFARAAAAGHERVVCEVNREPPNPASDAFHATLGFACVGEAARPGGKVVRYLERPLGHSPAPPSRRGNLA